MSDQRYVLARVGGGKGITITDTDLWGLGSALHAGIQSGYFDDNKEWAEGMTKRISNLRSDSESGEGDCQMVSSDTKKDQQQENRVEVWNQSYPAGTSVVLINDDHRPEFTTTRTPAFRLGNGQPVVSVTRQHGAAYDIDRLTPTVELMAAAARQGVYPVFCTGEEVRALMRLLRTILNYKLLEESDAAFGRVARKLWVLENDEPGGR